MSHEVFYSGIEGERMTRLYTDRRFILLCIKQKCTFSCFLLLRTSNIWGERATKDLVGPRVGRGRRSTSRVKEAKERTTSKAESKMEVVEAEIVNGVIENDLLT